MTGEELKRVIRRSGVSVSEIARQMETSPQNINNKLKKNSLRTDFLESVMTIINRCCPPLTEEQESILTGHQVIANGNQSIAAVNSNVDGNATALEKENETLRKQNDFLQRQVERLITLLESK